MNKTKQELFEYAVKMRQMGDSYRAMLTYLERNTDDKQTIKEIISMIDQLEKEKKVKAPEKSSGPSLTSIIMGIIFITAGGILVAVLWEKGYIAWLPVLLIIIGVYAFSGRMG